MSDSLEVALVSIVGTLGLLVIVLFVLSGFNAGRLGLGIKAFLGTQRDAGLADKVRLHFQPPPPEPPKPVKPSGAPVRFLALLQREGRLVDFLTENIQGYDDAQVGAAVREIHTKCQAAVKEHLELDSILMQEEGATVEIPVGFDPSAVRLLGNVTGQPPFRGTLVHRGWRVKQIKLAAPPEGQDEFVLQPAEVQLP